MRDLCRTYTAIRSRPLTMVLIPLALAVTGCSITRGSDGSTRNEEGTVVEGGEVDALRLRVGDCLAETAVDGSGEVESVPVVPCSEPHHTELYHSFQLAGDDFPVDPSVEQLAGEGCYDAFESFIGLAYEDSVWDISTIYPTPESWDQINDREVLCGTYRVDDGLSVGSAEGSAE